MAETKTKCATTTTFEGVEIVCRRLAGHKDSHEAFGWSGVWRSYVEWDDENKES